MNVKLQMLGVGALFFLGGGSLFGQKTDSVKTRNIDEVVVVGVQKKNRQEVTQAVSVVGGDELTRMAASSTGITNMLQGKMSGLQVSANSGKPGEPGSIRIRGAVNVSSSLGASDPLFVVDGIYMTQRQFNSIPASDIESVTELKDAASSAQYGARAANGVIVVTTKRGKSGKPVFVYDTRFGFGFKPGDKNFQMMNTAQKIQYENEMSQLKVNPNPVYTTKEQADLLAKDHNWEKDILKNSLVQYHNFSVRGGSENNKYFASIGYDSDSGILLELDGFKRYNGRFNFDQKITDRINMGFDFGVVSSKTQDQRFSYNALSPFYSVYTLNPYEPVYLSNGKFNPTTNSINPVDLRRNEVSFDARTRLTGQVFASYRILDGLTFKSTFGNIYDIRKNKNIIRKSSDIGAIYGLPDGQIRDTRSDLWSYVFNNRLDYSKTFGDHKISAVAMFEYNQENFGSLAGTKRIMLGPDITDVGSASTPQAVTGSTTSTRYVSGTGILDYNYMNRYLVSGSFRREGNSRLGTDNKYGDFWSASAAWNLARESFFNVDFFNDIKFRYSIGTTGNVAALLDYQNLLTVVSGDYGAFPTAGPSNSVGNSTLKWEAKKSQNLGVDIVMYRNRLKLSAEVFKDDRKDFLYTIPSTQYEGGGFLFSSVTNAGNIEIKGLESELNADVIRSANFDWTLRGNVSFLKYKVKSLYGTAESLSLGDGYTYMHLNMEPTVFKLVKSAGVDPNNGNALYYRPDGTVTNVYSSGDAQFLDGKSTLPSVYGGFGTTFRYGGFDLNADFSFQSGGYSYNVMAQNLVDFANYSSNMSTDAFNYWKKQGDVALLPKPVSTGLETTDAFLQKTDFVRFRSLELGYTFDKKFLGAYIPVSSFRIYASGQNLALWTKFIGDPEVAVASETQVNNVAFVPGSYMLYNYPNTRTYLVGLQVNF